MMTGLAVLKMVLTPSSARLASFANSGPRWSMIGVSMARRTRSGTGVGPGICRKWRPALRDEFLDMAFIQPVQGTLNGNERNRPTPRIRAAGAAQLAAMKDECDSQSRAF